MSSAKTLTEIAAIPGVLGIVTCSHDGEITNCAGDESELLGGILGHLDQTSRLIGECLGLEPLVEIRLLGKTLTASCVPRENDLCGILLDRKVSVNEILAQLPRS